MQTQKRFWIGLGLVNLCVVALLGLLMRSKILFPLPAINYKNILNAHSHLAFSGWVALVLIAFFIHDLLPAQQSRRPVYRRLLWGVQLTAVGMALTFPFFGYTLLSIVFSTGYIFVTYAFGWVFLKDLRKAPLFPAVRWLSIGAVWSLLLSSLGPFTLAYVMMSKSGNSVLYREALYAFLHFNYNGFFTLGIFAVFFARWARKGLPLPKQTKPFAALLVASVLPSLFISLLWTNLTFYYVLASIGALLILGSVYFFLPVFLQSLKTLVFQQPLARALWVAAFVSFLLKMVLTIGTLYPPLGNAVYGARPIIIGFLHLVFLAFVSFYVLGNAVEDGDFTRAKGVAHLPLYLFAAGVLGNEAFLMIQGLGILFRTNSGVYNWLLWAAALTLFLGSIAMTFAFFAATPVQKKGRGTNRGLNRQTLH